MLRNRSIFMMCDARAAAAAAAVEKERAQQEGRRRSLRIRRLRT